mgnify:CR=1 FL=1
MNKKLEDMIAESKLKEILHKNEAEKQKNAVVWVLAIIGAIAGIAAIAYAVFRFVTPDYLEDFDDDFDADGGAPDIGEKPLTYDGSNKDGNV